MKIDLLIQNITDQIKEAQLKLGYMKESIRLYFPSDSLAKILGISVVDSDELVQLLKDCKELHESKLGEMTARACGNRIEIGITAKGSEFVHKNIPEPIFLKKLIKLFENNHNLSIEEICDLFNSFSDKFICEKMTGEDFDYAIYFEDKNIDMYYYCIKMEMGHTIYHRFLYEDYVELLK